MAAALCNILVEQGATFSKTLTIESSPGTPLNVSAYTFTGAMKRSLVDSQAAATFSFDKTNAATGVVVWTLTAAQTANIAAQVHKYDVNMINSTSGETTRLLEGDAWVSGSASLSNI